MLKKKTKNLCGMMTVFYVVSHACELWSRVFKKHYNLHLTHIQRKYFSSKKQNKIIRDFSKRRQQYNIRTSFFSFSKYQQKSLMAISQKTHTHTQLHNSLPWRQQQQKITLTYLRCHFRAPSIRFSFFCLRILQMLKSLLSTRVQMFVFVSLFLYVLPLRRRVWDTTARVIYRHSCWTTRRTNTGMSVAKHCPCVGSHLEVAWSM